MDTNTRTHTLFAIFPDRATADRARADLLSNGFASDQVHLSSAPDVAGNVASGNAVMSGTHHDTSGGGLSGFFHRLFGGGDDYEEDRNRYSTAIGSGRCGVGVEADQAALDRAADILNRNGAIDIDEDRAVTDRRDVANTSGTGRQGRENASIPVVNEELAVGKRAVRRGAVRVYSTVREQPVQQNVELREEHVRVDRRPVDRAATDADLAAANQGVVEFTETVEEPIIEKRARVVEEVVVSKDVNARTQNVRDTVRKTDVRVDDTRGGTAANAGTGAENVDYDQDFRRDFQSRYGATGNYDEYSPAYRYGYETASDPRYRGRNWNEVESDLRSDYARRYPNSTWEKMKDSVRYGWDKVTGKA